MIVLKLSHSKIGAQGLMSEGPYIKDVRSGGGGGVNQKRTLADTGGQRQNADVRIHGHISTKKTNFSPDLA